MRVTALTVYPVKSLEGVGLDAASSMRAGLRGDRRWGSSMRRAPRSRLARSKPLLGLSAEPLEQTGSEGAIRLRDRAGGSHRRRGTT